MSNYQKVSVTVPVTLVRLVDKQLTPAGLGSPPKGAYSQLITMLLTAYAEKEYGGQAGDYLLLMELIQENPESSVTELKERLKERSNGF